MYGQRSDQLALRRKARIWSPDFRRLHARQNDACESGFEPRNYQLHNRWYPEPKVIYICKSAGLPINRSNVNHICRRRTTPRGAPPPIHATPRESSDHRKKPAPERGTMKAERREPPSAKML